LVGRLLCAGLGLRLVGRLRGGLGLRLVSSLLCAGLLRLVSRLLCAGLGLRLVGRLLCASLGIAALDSGVRLRCVGRFRTHIGRRTLRGRCRLLLLAGRAGSTGLLRCSHFHLFFLDDDLDVLIGRRGLLLDLLLCRVHLIGIDVHSICRSSSADGKARRDRAFGKICNFAGELSLLLFLTGFLFPLDPQKPKAGGDGVEPLAVLLFLLYLCITVEFDFVLVFRIEIHVFTLSLSDVCKYLQANFLLPGVNGFHSVLPPAVREPADFT
jgi:hypothetical protein